MPANSKTNLITTCFLTTYLGQNWSDGDVSILLPPCVFTVERHLRRDCPDNSFLLQSTVGLCKASNAMIELCSVGSLTFLSKISDIAIKFHCKVEEKPAIELRGGAPPPPHPALWWSVV
jgi:hypothetical protein